MTYDEALGVLGLDRHADAGAIRKAYLRQAKAHSPERDPEGFKRVRAAFESLRGQRVDAYEHEPGLNASFSDLVVASADDEAPVILADPLQQVRNDIESTQDPWQRIQLARAAALQHGSTAAYWLWLGALGSGAPDEEIAAVARAAVARGHANFTAFLRGRCARVLTDDELAQWYAELSSSPTPDAIGLAHLLLGRGQVAAAASLVELVLEVTNRDLLAMRAAASVMLDAILALFEHGAKVEAARATVAFATAYGVDGHDASDSIIRQTTRELAAIYEQLDSSIVRGMAKALRRRRPEEVDMLLLRIADSNPEHARAAAALLRRQAPVLAGLFSTALDAPEPAVQAGGRQVRVSVPAIARVLVFFVMTRLLTHGGLGHWFEGCHWEASKSDPVEVLCDRPELCSLAHDWSDAIDCTTSDMAWHRLNAYAKARQATYPLTMAQMIAVGTMKSETARRCRAAGRILEP